MLLLLVVCSACSDLGVGRDGGRTDASNGGSFEDTCPRGLTRPISVQSLIRIAREEGISLERDPTCSLHTGDIDAASNVADADSEDYDAITQREGHVMCTLGDEPGVQRPGHVRRTKYPDDEETYFDVANVSCAIYPEETGQVERLERVLAAVSRAPVNKRTCPAATPAPVALGELLQAARRHGIDLRRDRRCIAPGVVAQASNVVPYEATAEQQEKISIEQGEITCLLRGHPQRAADVIEEKAVVSTQFRYLNVTCTVAPLPDTNTQHVDRLRAVFSDLQRRRSP